MDDKKQFSRRLLAIGALFSLVLAAYFVTLFDAQIVHGAEYRARSIRANTKSETVVTSRGCGSSSCWKTGGSSGRTRCR